VAHLPLPPRTGPERAPTPAVFRPSLPSSIIVTPLSLQLFQYPIFFLLFLLPSPSFPSDCRLHVLCFSRVPGCFRPKTLFFSQTLAPLSGNSSFPFPDGAFFFFAIPLLTSFYLTFSAYFQPCRAIAALRLFPSSSFLAIYRPLLFQWRLLRLQTFSPSSFHILFCETHSMSPVQLLLPCPVSKTFFPLRFNGHARPPPLHRAPTSEVNKAQ